MCVVTELMSNLAPSDDCFILIKHFEGCKLDAYLDAVGVPTIGYGHTGASIKLGDTITQDQADKYLILDVQRTCKELVPLLDVDLSQNEQDAVIDFCYNLGTGRFSKSTLRTMLNLGAKRSASLEFTKWVKAGDRVLPGLVKRREAEQALFNNDPKWRMFLQ